VIGIARERGPAPPPVKQKLCSTIRSIFRGIGVKSKLRGVRDRKAFQCLLNVEMAPHCGMRTHSMALKHLKMVTQNVVGQKYRLCAWNLLSAWWKPKKTAIRSKELKIKLWSPVCFAFAQKTQSKMGPDPSQTSYEDFKVLPERCDEGHVRIVLLSTADQIVQLRVHLKACAPCVHSFTSAIAVCAQLQDCCTPACTAKTAAFLHASLKTAEPLRVQQIKCSYTSAFCTCNPLKNS
jgi:hypothetical protein